MADDKWWNTEAWRRLEIHGIRQDDERYSVGNDRLDVEIGDDTRAILDAFAAIQKSITALHNEALISTAYLDAANKQLRWLVGLLAGAVGLLMVVTYRLW